MDERFKDEYGNAGSDIFTICLRRRYVQTFETEIEIAADSEEEAKELALGQTEDWDNDCFEEVESDCDDTVVSVDGYDCDEDDEDGEDGAGDGLDTDGDAPVRTGRSSSKAPRAVEMPIDR